ncbi:MAG: hypothetical protein HFI26_13900 [Lachnospiraceae bacterium]|jgi:hypothetical protein|nr:hypothetical protein [Lachnospiraceae bacterium]
MIIITDRNLLDITTAKEIISKIQSKGFSSLTEYEKQQWSNGLKGALNFNDMNRIEGNILEISQMVGAEIVEPFTEWSMETLPTLKDFERIRHNTELIREKASVSNTPYVPELPLNRYDKINDIEKILFDAYLIASPEVPQYYIDEIYIDEEIGDI